MKKRKGSKIGASEFQSKVESNQLMKGRNVNF